MVILPSVSKMKISIYKQSKKTTIFTLLMWYIIIKYFLFHRLLFKLRRICTCQDLHMFEKKVEELGCGLE